MDVTQLIAQLINLLPPIFFYLVPLFVLIYFFRSPYFKGVLGEFTINLTIGIFLSKNDYHLIKNVTLPTQDGTTQIDHIIVSAYGVFVIETKNMKGWIFGGEHQKVWTQKIFKYTVKFQNPLHQNYKHVKTIEALFELRPDTIFSLVVFVGDSEFKTKMPVNVTYGIGYIRFIKSKNTKIFSEKDVDSIIKKIKALRLSPTLETERRHEKHVKQIKERKGKLK